MKFRYVFGKNPLTFRQLGIYFDPKCGEDYRLLTIGFWAYILHIAIRR